MAEPARGPVRSAAIIGAGVIGAGWAARLRLSGVDVAVFDPAPSAREVVDEVHDNAVAAWTQLDLLPATVGSVQMVESIEAAVGDVDLIVESVPERLELCLLYTSDAADESSGG